MICTNYLGSKILFFSTPNSLRTPSVVTAVAEDLKANSSILALTETAGDILGPQPQNKGVHLPASQNLLKQVNDIPHHGNQGSAHLLSLQSLPPAVTAFSLCSQAQPWWPFLVCVCASPDSVMQVTKKLLSPSSVSVTYASYLGQGSLPH